MYSTGTCWPNTDTDVCFCHPCRPLSGWSMEIPWPSGWSILASNCAWYQQHITTVFDILCILKKITCCKGMNRESSLGLLDSGSQGSRVCFLSPQIKLFPIFTHDILEPVLGRPFGHSAKHCSKSLLKKKFIPFLSSYAHSFTSTCTIFPLEWHM